MAKASYMSKSKEQEKYNRVRKERQQGKMETKNSICHNGPYPQDMLSFLVKKQKNLGRSKLTESEEKQTGFGIAESQAINQIGQLQMYITLDGFIC